jgi:hypothetical protein
MALSGFAGVCMTSAISSFVSALPERFSGQISAAPRLTGTKKSPEAKRQYIPKYRKIGKTLELAKKPKSPSSRLKTRVSLRANIPETTVVLLINEQGEKEKGRDEREFSWCSLL